MERTQPHQQIIHLKIMSRQGLKVKTTLKQQINRSNLIFRMQTQKIFKQQRTLNQPKETFLDR